MPLQNAFLSEKHAVKKTLFLLLILLLLTGAALAESGTEISITTAPSVIYPGRLERITFEAASATQVDLTVLDEAGNPVCRVLTNYEARPGVNHLTWNGLTSEGEELPEGNYILRLSSGSRTADSAVTVRDPLPRIVKLQLPGTAVLGERVEGTVESSQPGSFTLMLMGESGNVSLVSQSVEKGENRFEFTLQNVPAGTLTLEATLFNTSGIAGTPRQLSLEAVLPASPTPVPTPVPTQVPVIPSHQESAWEEKLSYWTLPIGDPVEDAATIWEVMMQPMTVIKGDQKEVYRLRKTPDKSSAKENIVGEVTYASQGVHVLETLDNGWTLVEVYNSSYGPNCASRRGYGNTAELICGYVETSLLQTVEPLSEYGLLIDKLEQTMYIYHDGECIGSLLVSTGKPTKQQPWNETPAGEFVMISKVGGFPAGNLWCDYGMRINGGCLIHEVPYIGNDNTPASARDYSSTVRQLGYKASHGCVRVQKSANEQGQNILWLWKNIKVNTKVLIWEDTGRHVPYPPDDTPVYYNPTGGKYFHQNQYCPGVKKRYLPLTETTYGELETLFEKPQACPTCCELMTKEEVDALNAKLNPGE